MFCPSLVKILVYSVSYLPADGQRKNKWHLLAHEKGNIKHHLQLNRSMESSGIFVII